MKIHFRNFLAPATRLGIILCVLAAGKGALAASRCESAFSSAAAMVAITPDIETAAQQLADFVIASLAVKDHAARELLLDNFEVRLNELSKIHGSHLKDKVRALVKRGHSSMEERKAEKSNQEERTRKAEEEFDKRWTRSAVHELPQHPNFVSLLGLETLDESTLAASFWMTGSPNKTLLYNFKEKKFVGEIIPDEAHLENPRILPSPGLKDYMLLNSRTHMEAVNLKTGERHVQSFEAEVKAHGGFHARTVSPDGKFLFLAAHKEMRILTLPDFQTVFLAKGDLYGRITDFATDPQGRFVLGAGQSSLVLIDLAQKPLEPIDLHTHGLVRSGKFPSPVYSRYSGKFYVNGEIEGQTEHLIEVDPRAKTVIPSSLSLTARDLSVSPNGEDLIFFNDADPKAATGPLTVVHLPSGEQFSLSPPLLQKPRFLIKSVNDRFVAIRQEGDLPIFVFDSVTGHLGRLPDLLTADAPLEFTLDGLRLFAPEGRKPNGPVLKEYH